MMIFAVQGKVLHRHGGGGCRRLPVPNLIRGG
jgi:hypothetical protein